MPLLYFDCETYSECDLKAHGTHRYAEHPSTEITVAQWAIGAAPLLRHAAPSAQTRPKAKVETGDVREVGPIFESDDMETWKDVPGFEGRYQVSDLGLVKGLQTLLKPVTINSGYQTVHLYMFGKRHVVLVHRLVAYVFVPGYFDGAHVNHKDGDRLNNRASNLEWVTRSGNMRHAKATRGEWARCCPVRGVSIEDGHVVYFDSQLRAEKTLAGRASSAIHHCLIGKKKSAYGYTWSRA